MNKIYNKLKQQKENLRQESSMSFNKGLDGMDKIRLYHFLIRIFKKLTKLSHVNVRSYK